MQVRPLIVRSFIAAAAAAAGLENASIVLAPLGDTPGPAVSVDAERPTYPASMIKVPIAAALALTYADGERRPADRIRVEARQLTPNDAPSPFVLGYETTLEATARAMIADSDNVATNVLIDALGRDRIGAICRERLGLQATAVRRKLSGALPLIDDPEATGRNAHPAADAAALFAAVARERDGTFAPVYAALAAQIWNGKLSAGLEPADRFAHKTGDTDDASHDGGILSLADGRSYVLVAYTTLASSPESDARFAAFARTLRAALG
ncbi:MAG: serine hydrolase [Candidatus Eremiobacteraeota bacterium]|nr:serine hydrolase [Candidatus Eremiobacteraeota bacterium]